MIIQANCIEYALRLVGIVLQLAWILLYYYYTVSLFTVSTVMLEMVTSFS